ncbi:uncharacterized protein JN550_012823 [Neoarthrinium moseri]|uniref:uncharacterized protein n=1 Tax=Neoarthrinium moseri TaxID=1658444 RepID=UPI001FDB0DA2|nr:uncharacterized protein JN550_012823 [Neoarthrinium moseri]KAI1858292.1 hypothetical protein JN550_012823 [Neoarthrinium moseri]
MKLHEEHVRIGPNEVSVADIDVYTNAIYAQNTNYLKDERFYKALDNPSTTLLTERRKDVHASEKRLMSHAFSRANIIGLHNAIYGNTNRWIWRLLESVARKDMIPLWHATQCLTLENASYFSYGSSDGTSSKDFYHPLFAGFETFAPLAIIFQHFPIMASIVGFLTRVFPFGFTALNQGAKEGLERLKYSKSIGQLDGMVMFDSMMARAQKAGVPVDPARLVQNGSLMLTAGTGTTAISLTAAIHHLVSQPQLWYELQRELLGAFPNPSAIPSVYDLDNVPLLNACIKEAIRVSVPIRGRHPRVVPKGGLSVGGLTIPEGVIISASPLFHCHDAAVFPNPEEFNPQRWISGESKQMRHNFVPFSHGSRSCIGQNLAIIEMQVALSQVVMKMNPGEIVDRKITYIDYGITVPDSLVRVTLGTSTNS